MSPSGAAQTPRLSCSATIHADGTITAGGHRGSIHKVAAACLGLPTANGWTSWLFPDLVSGQELLLDTLRPG